MKKNINFLLFVIIACCSIHAKAQLQSGEGNIIETDAPRGWIIKTFNSCYQLVIDDNGNVKPVFYGNVQQAGFQKKNSTWTQSIAEVPVRGGFPGKTPMLEVIYKDNVRDAELQFVQGEITVIDGRQTLQIIQKDRFYPLQITTYIRVLPEFDILEKWAVLKNNGTKESIRVENIQSGSVQLPANQYVLTHKAGKWGHEFQPQETKLTPGIKTLVAVDFKSFTNPSWFMVRPESEQGLDNGAAWYGTIEYSGNWRMDFNMPYDGNLQITAGINFWDTWWNLGPGKSFETPKLAIGYTNKGSQGAAQNMTTYVRKAVLPATNRAQLRPVLYNSWYATEFNVNEDQQLKLATIAKEIGVELFVIDDGWFKGRVNDKAGLGDWEVDKTKFPRGLQPLIKKVNDMGMQFGLWIEPEMINPDSDLYRKHPDWVFNFPNRKRNEARNQLVLNLAREDVYQYLLKGLNKLLQENNIQFIKWDHNRSLSEPGWPDAPVDMQREVRIRYINNLHRLIDELRGRFPNVLFESCSSGGGRADLGMLSRMDQVWVSDNTDPIDRLFIQYSYLDMLPANTMVSWITHENWHQQTTLDFKFDVAMSGVLGIGNDLTNWSDADKKIAKEKIALYKQIRPVVQNGTTYRLISPYIENRSAVQYVSEDKKTSVIFCYNLAEYLKGSRAESQGSNIIKFKGLDPQKEYSIEKVGDNKSTGQQIYSGDFLMEIGIAWPLRGVNKSQVLIMKQV